MFLRVPKNHEKLFKEIKYLHTSILQPFKAAHPGQIDLYGFVQYPENIEIPEVMRDLLEKLLQQEPEDRFDYEHIKQHKFFESTNWDDIKQEGFQQKLKG